MARPVGPVEFVTLESKKRLDTSVTFDTIVEFDTIAERTNINFKLYFRWLFLMVKHGLI